MSIDFDNIYQLVKLKVTFSNEGKVNVFTQRTDTKILSISNIFMSLWISLHCITYFINLKLYNNVIYYMYTSTYITLKVTKL
jgi:hypothetical protein